MNYTSTCKYCGRGSLEWKQVKGKWRMVDTNDVPHVCQSLINAKIKESNERRKYASPPSNT